MALSKLKRGNFIDVSLTNPYTRKTIPFLGKEMVAMDCEDA